MRKKNKRSPLCGAAISLVRVLRPVDGGSLVLVLFLLLLLSILGFSILFVSDVDLKTSKNYRYSATALYLAESGVREAVYRLNLEDEALPVPNGSLVTVNNLVNYDARINYDPDGILSDNLDDDGDGLFDEPDELNLARDWEVRILLTPDETHPGDPYEVIDDHRSTGPPWGNKVVVPTIQPQASWMAYTSRTVDGNELLIRFKRLSDYGITGPAPYGDQIVFYDRLLATNGVEDRNTLSALGGDGDPADDSPYNITWTDGTHVYPASGRPVIIVRCMGRVSSSGSILGLINLSNLLTAKSIQVEAYQKTNQVSTKALCSCDFLDLNGDTDTDSYKSSEGDYGTGPVYSNGDVGSDEGGEINGHADVHGKADLGGNFVISGSTYSISGDFTTGGTITGDKTRIYGTITQNATPRPSPCPCDLDMGQIVLRYELDETNDEMFDEDTDIPESCAEDQMTQGIIPGHHPYLSGTNTVLTSQCIYDHHYHLKLEANETIILPGGKYYFESIDISGSASIQVGQDLNGDGTVDAPPTRPVEIYCDGQIKIAGRGIVNNTVPRNLVIYASTLYPEWVEITGTAEFRGVVIAPNSLVKLTGTGAIKGSILGSTIYTGGTADVHYDEELRNLITVPGYTVPVTWKDSD